MPDGTVYRGIRSVQGVTQLFRSDEEYKERMYILYGFCGVSKKQVDLFAENDKWPRYGICTCHWAVDAFYFLPNGQVGVYKEARPLPARELAASLRVHVDARARAHAKPLDAAIDRGGAGPGAVCPFFFFFLPPLLLILN